MRARERKGGSKSDAQSVRQKHDSQLLRSLFRAVQQIEFFPTLEGRFRRAFELGDVLDLEYPIGGAHAIAQSNF